MPDTLPVTAPAPDAETIRAMIDVMHAGVLVVDERGTVAACNPAGGKLFGVLHTEMQGQLLADPRWKRVTRAGEPLDPEADPAARALRTGRSISDAEFGIVRPDGSRQWVLANASPLFRARESRPWAVVITLSDITLRGRADHAVSALLSQERSHRESAEASAMRLRILEGITDATRRGLGLVDFLDELLDRLRAALGADVAATYLSTPDGGALVLRAWSGDEVAPTQSSFPIGENFVGRIAAERRTLVVPDAGLAPANPPGVPRSRFRAMIGAPLVVAERVVGVVAAGALRTLAFTQEDFGLLELIADRLALAVERARLFEQERELRERAELARRQVRAIAARLETARAAEQNRIARHLEEDLGPAVRALRPDLEWLDARIAALARGDEAAPLRWRAESIGAALEKIVSSMAEIATDLHPAGLAEQGLEGACLALVADFSERARVRVDAEMPIGDPIAAPDVRAVVYRVFKEVLTNIARHANASRVVVRGSVERAELLLEVRDDGSGIPAEELANPRALGIVGMRERTAYVGGTLEIESAPRGGTTVRLRVPISEESHR